jgi:hypothetical protein
MGTPLEKIPSRFVQTTDSQSKSSDTGSSSGTGSRQMQHAPSDPFRARCSRAFLRGVPAKGGGGGIDAVSECKRINKSLTTYCEQI